jgi:hypothetical protein
MNNAQIQRPEEAFLPLIGRFAWSVRNSFGTYLTMEFGSPHLHVRDPIVASPDAPLGSRKVWHDDT